MTDNNIDAPVLLIAFNRPDTTQIVFDRIRDVKPAKLYVAVDGPRKHIDGESALCEKVIEITRKVDWDCQTNYLIRENNLGCKQGVVQAISWVLEKEDRVIIIEDDVVPAIPFFYFAQELLEKYQDDHRIAMISGNNYTPLKNINSDYLFSKYAHIWGWATWKRVWDDFDVHIPELEDVIRSGCDQIKFTNKAEKNLYEKYLRRLLSAKNSGYDNYWGPQFGFFKRKKNFLSIVPRVNLSSNIGNVSSRSNNVSKINEHYWPGDDGFVLKKYPVKVEVNQAFENYHFNKHMRNIYGKPSIHKRIIRKALRVIQ